MKIKRFHSKPFVLMLFLVPVFCLSLKAQDKKTQVTGIVKNENGTALANVSVMVKNTKTNFSAGTTTDSSGVFSFSKLPPGGGYTFTFSSVGFETQKLNGYTLQPDAAFTLVTRLRLSERSLDDVIVIGYGTAKKKDLVGSLDVVPVKEAGATSSTNPSELLIGKAAGVQVVQANGVPGADAQIIIRGTGSFTGVDPLYIIDGIQADKNLFNALSAQDIENITILKDASSTAIYGSAAANGVVMITTRRGRPGPPKISITSQWGEAKAWKQLHLLDAAQYVALLQDFAATSNTTLPAKFSTPSVLVDSNNWQNRIFRQAPVSENDINISGGSDKVLYTFSVGYINQESIVQAMTFKRLNTRIGLDENLGRFHLGQSLAIRYTNTVGQNGSGGPYANITDGIGYAPYKPVYDPSVLGGYSIVSNIADFSNVNNPLQAVNLVHNVQAEFVVLPQIFGEVNIINGLKFRTQFSAEIGGGKNSLYQFPYTASNNLGEPRESSLGYNDYSFYTLENYFSYNKTFGKHNISATVGNSYLDPGKSSSVTDLGTGIPNDNIQNISVAQTLAVTGASYGYARASVISYFGRLVYAYDNKYILSGSLREDGASNFGTNNQFGYFPGVGFAWRFIDENFMKNLSFIDDGKLRIGWGRTGNNNIPTTGVTSVLTFSGNPNGNLVYSLGSNKTYVAGTTIASLANPNIKWETTDQTDIGLDLAFFNKQLNVTVDWYDRKSSGLLVSIPLPASVGADLTGAQPVEIENAADADNKGLEFTAGYRYNVGRDLTLNINANIGFNKNRVISLGSQFAAPIQAGVVQNLSTFTITKAGYPIGSYYGYKVDHVAKDQAEINALNAQAAQKTGNPNAVYQAGLLPGDFIFKDIRGLGQITDSDETVLGNPIPKFVYGFSAGLTFKNFDLNMVFSGVAGLKILNSVKFFTLIEATGHNATTGILNRWRQPGDVAAEPRAGQDATASGNLAASDWWLESGAYLRLRNLTVGYSLPTKVLNNINGGEHVFTRIRFYIAAQNLLTITGYSGYDPEISTQMGGSYIFTRGIDDGQLPQPRTFLAGLQLGF
jgi:TonB-dependent starch-binding outer membrane protein SusC